MFEFVDHNENFVMGDFKRVWDPGSGNSVWGGGFPMHLAARNLYTSGVI